MEETNPDGSWTHGHMSNLSKLDLSWTKGVKKKSFFGGGETRFWSGRESERGREEKKIKTSRQE